MHAHAPDCAVYEITLACNLRCSHCGATAGEARKRELTTDESKRLIKELSEIGTRGVALMGGEPLLRRDWYMLAKEVNDRGMALSIITNGTLINEAAINKLKDLEPGVVAISIDGSEEAHDRIRGKIGAFRKSMHALDRLLGEGIETSVITTLSKQNIGELPKLRKLLGGKALAWQVQMASCNGARFDKSAMLSIEEYYSAALYIASMREAGVPVAGAHDFGYFSCMFPPINAYMEFAGCQAGLGTLGISSNGALKGCLALPDSAIEGYFLKDGIKEIWNSPNAFAYTRKFENKMLGGACKRCVHAGICQGGCSDISLSITGKMHRDPYCFHRIEHELEKRSKVGK